MTISNLRSLIILILAGLLLTWSCFGFANSQEGWDKDYDSYRIGAYINGTECHENAHSIFDRALNNYNGFKYYQKDSLVMIINRTGDWRWTDPQGNKLYSWEVCIVLDKSSFKPGNTYSFSGRFADNMTSFFAFERGEFDVFEPLPFITCYFIKTPLYENRSNPFIATEGEISIGGFDEYGRNEDTIFFNLKVEDDNGDTIDIKDGYCKRFYDPYNQFIM